MTASSVRISWNRSPSVVARSSKLLPMQLLQYLGANDQNGVSPCQIELWPTYVCSIPAGGVAISRDLLSAHLPAWVIATERVRAGLSVLSSLEQISNATAGHCSIRWRGRWSLFAHSPVTIGGVICLQGAEIPLLRTTTLLIGQAGWPVTVHLGAVALPL